MVEIELKLLLDTVTKLPESFSPETSTVLTHDNFLAVIYDFLKYQLKIETSIKNFRKNLVKLSNNTQQILLIEVGILSNVDILPLIREILKVKQIIDIRLINILTELAKSLANVVSPQNFLNDLERGEEIVRKLAKELEIDIKDETQEESSARLLQVDSLELQNVKEQIELKIRQALEEARKKAEAAAKVTRE